MTVRDPEARELLGLEPMKTLKAQFLEAVKSSDGGGMTARQMHKNHPEVDLLDWMLASHELLKEKKVRHEWSPLKGHVTAAQEGRYFLPNEEIC